MSKYAYKQHKLLKDYTHIQNIYELSSWLCVYCSLLLIFVVEIYSYKTNIFQFLVYLHL